MRAALASAGVAVRDVTTAPAAAPTAVAYPADRSTAARRFGEALGVAVEPRPSDVVRVTLVLGDGDPSSLLTALQGLVCAGTATHG